MTATRPSKRPAAVKTRRGLDASPSCRTRSQTHRDRLCALLLKLDLAAISRTIKVLKSYGGRQRSPQSLVEWDSEVVKHLGGRCAAQVKPAARKATASRSSRAGNSSCVPATFSAGRPIEWSLTNNVKSVFYTLRAFGSSATPAQTLHRFKHNIVIVKDDIGSVTRLNNHKVDGIAFPTTSSLQHAGTGAAAAVFRRAGHELSSHIRDTLCSHVAGASIGGARFGTGAVRVTPGFGAGVDKLILAVGPSVSEKHHCAILEATYRSVLEAAMREDLKCLAVASISTGSNGISSEKGARAALRTIVQFLSREEWPGVVGIVCYEQTAYDSFTKEKQAMLEAQ